MVQLRLDVLMQQWVVFAPDRSLRPQRTMQPAADESAENDPFLEGRENDTPGETFAIRNPGTQPDTPGWQVRVVPNKYPALLPLDNQVGIETEDNSSFVFQTSRTAVGVHEVIIECPHFETNLARLSQEQITRVLLAYRTRIRQLHAEPTIKQIVIFKNKGAAAGATIPHSHSQLIGSGQIPFLTQARLSSAKAYFETHGKNLFAETLAAEREQGERVILETDHFLAYCPYASRFPFEMKILPNLPDCHFENVTDSQLRDLGIVLRTILGKMEIALDDCPYNFILHTAPFNIANNRYYSWQIEIIPRLGKLAGYEVGTGDYINIELPETAAKKLRAASK